MAASYFKARVAIRVDLFVPVRSGSTVNCLTKSTTEHAGCSPTTVYEELEQKNMIETILDNLSWYQTECDSISGSTSQFQDASHHNSVEPCTGSSSAWQNLITVSQRLSDLVFAR